MISWISLCNISVYVAGAVFSVPHELARLFIAEEEVVAVISRSVQYSTVQYSTVQYSDLQAAARPRLCHGQLPGVLARPLQRAPTPGSQGGGEHHGLVAGRAVRGSDGGGGG